MNEHPPELTDESTGGADSFAPAESVSAPDRDPEPLEPKRQLIPVVGLGGSAGSIEALQIFFENLSEATGAAYVVVIHLSPEHESALANILQRTTRMPVAQVDLAVKIKPDHVYVIPPGKYFSMTDGILQSTDLIQQKGRLLTVDLFFRTLAETYGVKGTGIVLSGSDSDGAIGLKRIKERGGLTMCQDPAEAMHDGMPRAALATGMVDWILPVAQMPGRLQEFRENGRRLQLPPEQSPAEAKSDLWQPEKDETAFREVLAFFKARTGHDFSAYKRATVLRRIGRRMQVNGTGDLEAYLTFVRTHPGETGALLQDLLISVTNFFRDKDAFDALENVISELFKGKGSSDQIRVWVPGCATGEEAYSIAILLSEFASSLPHPPSVQVFATDLDQSAIDTAREGRYLETIAADISRERLREFFSNDSGTFRVRRSIRETVLFARHDLLKDSPFSRLDLVSCRNLLIYLNREAQKDVLDTFHFALQPEAFLFLGSSESAVEASSHFTAVDKKNRLYQRRPSRRPGQSIPAAAPLSFVYQANLKAPGGFQRGRGGYEDESLETGRHSWRDLHLKLIESFAPPSLVIDRDYEIVHMSTTVGRFLQFSAGEPTMNVVRLAHPRIRTELRSALFRVMKSRSPMMIPAIEMEVEGRARWVDLTVRPVDEVSPEFLLVIFNAKDEPPAGSVTVRGAADLDDDRRSTENEIIRHLEEELDHMRAGWRETIEQYEASTEELKASNEELQAMNEELRSTTEELGTGREELQAINEEVVTINQELKSKVDELSHANSDLQNLMASTRIATIFLDRKLQINRFTPSTTGIFNFIPTDIGRPLSDLTHRLEYPRITMDAEAVMKDLTQIEREVRDVEGRWYLARMLPYRTTEDKIAGVVITCVEITERKEAEQASQWLSSIVQSSNDAIISFTMDNKIVSWNRGAERLFGYSEEEMIGRDRSILAPDELQNETMVILDQLRRGEVIDQLETVRLRKDGQRIPVSLSASVIGNETGVILGATAIFQDISARQRTVEELRQARDELEIRVGERTIELRKRVKQLSKMSSELTQTEQRERKRIARILHDDLQQLLVAAKMRVESLEEVGSERGREEIRAIASVIDEALANSRSLAIELSPPVLSEGLGRALEWLCGTWVREKLHLRVERQIDLHLDARQDDVRNLVFLAVKELLFNVVKHSGRSEARVILLASGDGFLKVVVSDEGIGFDTWKLAERSQGTGFGLMGLTERLEMLGGELVITSKPGEGAKAVITIPGSERPADGDGIP